MDSYYEAPLSEGEVQVQVLGRMIRVTPQADPVHLNAAVSLLEQTFRDMDRAYELRWGCPPSALDTSTWLLMGALNLAHRAVCREQEASRHTQDLEQTLSRLLDDVPEDSSTEGPLFS